MHARPQRYVVGVSLLAAVLVVIHAGLWDVVRWNHGSFIANPARLVGVGDGKATLFRLSLMADALGSYLLTLPATVALWRHLRGRAEWVEVAALGGVIYAVVGAVVAVGMAAAGAPLIRSFDGATGPRAAAIASDFAVAMNAAIATWQTVCVLSGGLWWLASGWLLREQWRWFARFSMMFGGASLLVGGLKIVGVDLDSPLPATLVFSPIALWIGWLGSNLGQRAVSRAGSP